MLIGYARISTHDQNLDIHKDVLKELTYSAGDIRFGEGQQVELKGLAGLKRVYSVDWK